MTLPAPKVALGQGGGTRRFCVAAVALFLAGGVGCSQTPAPTGQQTNIFGGIGQGNDVGGGGLLDSAQADGWSQDGAMLDAAAQDGAPLDAISPNDTVAQDGAPTDTSAEDGSAADASATDLDTAGTDDDVATPDGESDAAPQEDGALVDDAKSDAPSDDSAAQDGDNTDASTDDGVSDGASVPDAKDSGGDAAAETGGGGGGPDPFGEDVPWGSPEDAEPFDAGPTNYPDAGAGGVQPMICTSKIAELNLKEEKVGGKVDVVWWIDTSGSMSQEAKYLNDNINAFAQFISAANIDFRMILVGNGFSLCIQPPLGGPGCTDGPQYQHKKITIGSTNGPSILITQYATWSTFLRPEAAKNIVAVTDDNQSTPPTCTVQCGAGNGGALGAVCSKCKAQWFVDELQKKDPANFPLTPLTPYGFVHHSIVAYDSAADCPTIAQKGAAYLELTAMTGGAKHKICVSDWKPIFQQLAQAVIQTAKPGCEYKIPFPVGVKPNANFGLSYVAKDDLFAVPAASGNSCAANGAGFTIDNLDAPAKVTLCPASCDLLKGGGNIQFDFGCFGTK